VTYEVHPVADLFPMLADDELTELAEDIKQRGLLQPIVLDPQGRVLDGRNRLAACERAGVEPAFDTYEGDDPDGYALAVNIARRHLSKGQRALVAADAMLIIDKSFITTRSAAKLADVSQPMMVWANCVRRYADLHDAVLSGTQQLNDAYRVGRERDDAKAEREEAEKRLREHAHDLMALVDEGRVPLDEAINTLDLREEKARREEETRRGEEQRKAHEESVQRARDIEAAQRFAGTVVTEFRSAAVAIVTGVRLGERGLLTKGMIRELREVIDLMEGEL
jgi:nicotinamide riboside kinase